MKTFYILVFGLFATANALSFMDLYEWFLYKVLTRFSWTQNSIERVPCFTVMSDDNCAFSTFVDETLQKLYEFL